MSINRKTLMATLIAPALTFGSAHAAELGGYLGGSIGQTTIKIDDIDFDKSDTGWKAFGGYNFLPWLGVEGGYIDFGSPSDDVLGDNVDVDLTGWQIFLVGSVPVGPVDLFVKAGGIEAKVDVHVSGFGSESDSDEYFAYGAGAAWNIGKFALRVEAEGYDANNVDDLYFLSAGVTYHL
jgi:OOP family OmpA-OmpF porin